MVFNLFLNLPEEYDYLLHEMNGLAGDKDKCNFSHIKNEILKEHARRE